jgi:hypothetical protein
VRLLFVFDAAREAIVLVAGDKAGRWRTWYAEAIPLAGERYAAYQKPRGGGRRMKAVRWEDTKRQVRELNPDRDTPERVASRERGRAAMRAEQRGYQLAQLRKNTGLTQAQVAAVIEEVEQLQPADAVDVAQPGLGEELRALARRGSCPAFVKAACA